MSTLQDHEEIFRRNILSSSSEMASDSVKVSGIDFNHFQGRNITVVELLEGLKAQGFQGTELTEAVAIINDMILWEAPQREAETGVGNIIFLGCTSNLVSSGTRESVRYCVEHKKVQCLVITAGAVEEDIIKCMSDSYLNKFTADDKGLHENHLNRIGNIVVPNANYIAFDEWATDQLHEMLAMQQTSRQAIDDENFRSRKAAVNKMGATFEALGLEKDALVWTPSSIIDRFGEMINDRRSILYWAHVNGIPVFCPAITDGSFGDIVSAFQFRCQNFSPPARLLIDIAEDINQLNTMARRAQMYGAKMGAVILGAGVVKHHIMNACLQGGGADAAVYINTAIENDGSDAGASTSEAVSWGKLKPDAPAVKVWADATIVFPLVIAGTWAKV